MGDPASEKKTTLRDEPLVRFVVLGVALLVAERLWAGRVPTPAPPIVVTSAFVDGLRARHTARGGDAPSPTSDDVLVAEFVRDEVLYREAVARGLEDGDPIVRRRLVQAMELVLTTEIEVPEPDDAALERFLADHASDFERAGVTSLEHVYFARSPEAADRAAVALASLGAGTPPDGLGDPFLAGRRFGPVTNVRLDATFGPGFAAALAPVEVGAWAGPLESSYGLHLVHVEHRDPARVSTLDEVRTALEAAWESEERARRLELAVEVLVAATPIVRAGDGE